MIRILVVGGVTAAGKTEAAIDLAHALDGELIGADSVQVYRGFDIGSAKPTAAELGGVAHHLLDVLDPDQEIDAMRFAGLADRAIEDVHARGRLPIVVGGTGLWIRALLKGLVELPPVDLALRAALEAEANAIGDLAMHARLAEADPTIAARLHPNDRVRVLRALEVWKQTGEPLGVLQRAHRKGSPRYDAQAFALDRPRDVLYPALKARIRGMIDRGWVDEVRGLVARWGGGVRALSSVGYRQMLAHVVDGVPIEQVEQEAYRATRIYTRRQRTWFRGEGTELTDAETLRSRLDALKRFRDG